MRRDRKKESSLRYVARGVGTFGKDMALDAGGELLDLCIGTLAGLGTFGVAEIELGEFNPRDKEMSARPWPYRRRR
ncbi:MAG: hypothetical protein HY669_03440 [Chloroflexi bacterium]|nr:hypothetical protein [Chloroflexota bacterium]